MTDIEKAMLNPTTVFRTPEEVLLGEDMSRIKPESSSNKHIDS